MFDTVYTKSKKTKGGNKMRQCDICEEKMNSGYVVDDNSYYCSDKCLHEHYTQEEYNEMYEQDVAYHTEWEEE